VQFAIFRKIHGGHASPVFLVGDPKQAIYSFRNADLHAYLRARESADAEYTLVHNQRSVEGLIAALNGLFGTNPRAFLLDGLDYHRVAMGDKQRRDFVDRSLPARHCSCGCCRRLSGRASGERRGSADGTDS